MEQDDTKLEIYKMYVQDALSVTEKRHNANYLNVQVIVLLAGSIFARNLSGNFERALVSSIGLLLCLAWYFLIGEYKKLNTAKFNYILEMEKQLPFQPYSEEWEELSSKKPRYKLLTKVERWLPVIFGLAFFAILSETSCPYVRSVIKAVFHK